MPGIEIEPLEDEHLRAAAALLAKRHARHRATEALLPEISDFHSQLKRDLDHEAAGGVIAVRGDDLVAYMIGRAPIVSMPHWGGILSDQQIAELIAYLKTLK